MFKFEKECPFKKRKGDCYHTTTQEIRRYEMPPWSKRKINHVHYLRTSEKCKGKIIKTEIAQIHILGTAVGFSNKYRNVLRHDYYELAGQTSRHDLYSFR